jgi:hypothetical protein
MTRLEAAAKFLGGEWHVDGRMYRGCEWVGDDELCMALLRKAAERGLWPGVAWGPRGQWCCHLANLEVDGPTPIDAVLAAIEQLQEST